ncbi:ATP-dependent RNA helicase SUV3L, mitochondrial [Smittium culicis]|uniref:RNA helicase n=1 Tax=Smittium culicis TaxID=133412 RepID=A0A1R1XTL2_9FUNG|nr:ATP-dependent RNA helicase SUV3L, mitochondrial [Smittium culicis]OMJ18209.1 ATP-dependent RNA helicase SUV3L, mitochondrial [Smittium culicis]
MHVGPTNSGKTYHAINRLKEAKTGIYCSPLRLLAHEIYTLMNNLGKPCELITGEDKRMPTVNGEIMETVINDEGEIVTPMLSSTIEMSNFAREFEVAVIDEIQMIQDSQRGWAWTNVLLGIKAREIHLCGEESSVPLVKKIFGSLHEKVIVKKYERLSKLQTSDQTLNANWKNIKEGDCVVAFSRKKIFEIQKQVESVTGMKCAVIYGGLPPDNRSRQANLFNDPTSEYKVLIASDAVGMGLNLKIRRTIFDSLKKFDGNTFKPLTTSQIKQIGGRAGRFNVGYDIGIITT